MYLELSKSHRGGELPLDDGHKDHRYDHLGKVGRV